MKWLTGRRDIEPTEETEVKKAARKVIQEHERLKLAVEDLQRALTEKTLQRKNDGG